DDEKAAVRGGNNAVDIDPRSAGCIHIRHRRAFELQELLEFILSRPDGDNTIKHRVDGVRHIRTAIGRKGGVVQEGLSGAETIIQLRNETTGFGAVDKDQSSLPPDYDEAIVSEKHSRRDGPTIRAAG